MPSYERTRLCGCGECRFKPISAGPCPQENSKKASWLWKTVFPKEELIEEGNEVTLDTTEPEVETLEAVTV